jgi:hypothetical protein
MWQFGEVSVMADPVNAGVWISLTEQKLNNSIPISVEGKVEGINTWFKYQQF